MKRLNYLWCLVLMAVMAVSCSEDFDTPPMVVPTALNKPNMTLAEFKAKYWDNARNFCDTVKEDIVIHGYVSANDVSGNLYKVMYIQDETAGIGLSIDANSLNTTYRVGQEIVISMKDCWIGKYNGQYLIGQPEWYAAQSVWEAGRMPLEIFKQFVELNGLPNTENVKPVVTKITDFLGKSDQETQLKYQGQLVEIQNVKWDGADGVKPFSEPDATTYRTVTDDQGNQLQVANSNYSDFHSDPMPMGEGNVVGVLTMTGSDQWRLLLRDVNDCVGFESGTKGASIDPYFVNEAIELQGSGKKGWMTGYIVGAVAPEVTTVSGNNDIEWKAPTTLPNTLVIAASPDVTDINQCIIVPLPQDSRFRQLANLRDNPEVYKTQIWVKGKFDNYMGKAGLLENSGTSDEFMLLVATGGVTTLNEGFEGGAIPSDWQNVQIAGNKAWYVTSCDNNAYAAMTGYKGTAPFDSWLISPAVSISKAETKILNFRTQVNGYGSTTTKFQVYLMNSDNPAIAELIELHPTIATAPASGYSTWAYSGDLDLSQYEGTYYIGFRYSATTDANFATWCVDDVKFNAGSGGGGGGDTPEPQPIVGNRADFETMNNGTASSYYNSFTSTAGWKATNCNLLTGGTQDSNPTFTIIGKIPDTDTYAMAPCMNGKTSAVGSIVSPTIAGGMTSLSFNYVMPYSDTKLKFAVNIKQGGATVKTFTVNNDSPAKLTLYTFNETVDITGDFVIELVNLSPSGLDQNKDRVAIFNLTWEPKTSAAPRRWMNWRR